MYPLGVKVTSVSRPLCTPGCNPKIRYPQVTSESMSLIGGLACDRFVSPRGENRTSEPLDPLDDPFFVRRASTLRALFACHNHSTEPQSRLL